MFKRNLTLMSFVAALTLIASPRVFAAMPVVDVRAIAQMAQEMSVLQNQLSTLRNHLTQAQQQYQSMTGSRGMERLLSGTVRNYLPPDWAALSDTLLDLSSAYMTLSSNLNGLVSSSAVLSDAQISRLTSSSQSLIQRDRRMTAMTQVLARQALANTSQRFAAIQQLIDTIPAATDEKAILDLNSRIAAEQAMLQNEQTKLQMLNQSLAAEELARKQQARERAIADIGSFRELPPLVLP